MLKHDQAEMGAVAESGELPAAVISFDPDQALARFVSTWWTIIMLLG